MLVSFFLFFYLFCFFLLLASPPVVPVAPLCNVGGIKHKIRRQSHLILNFSDVFFSSKSDHYFFAKIFPNVILNEKMVSLH